MKRLAVLAYLIGSNPQEYLTHKGVLKQALSPRIDERKRRSMESKKAMIANLERQNAERVAKKGT